MRRLLFPRSAVRIAAYGAGAIAAACIATAAFAAATPKIDVVASNFTFTPATIEVHVGEPTTLHLSSSGGVHGVESSEIGLAKTTIVPGKATDVMFTPAKAGTFAVHCAVMCGAGHEAMVLTVRVVPAT